MHVLTFMYPTQPGAEFNFEHYFKVHLPLGAGLTDKLFGIRLPRMIVQKVRTTGEIGEKAPYYVLCHAMFETKEDVDRFSALFSFPEAKKRLSEDWPKYTPLDPEVIISEWVELDNIDEMITHFKSEMEPDRSSDVSELSTTAEHAKGSAR